MTLLCWIVGRAYWLQPERATASELSHIALAPALLALPSIAGASPSPAAPPLTSDMAPPPMLRRIGLAVRENPSSMRGHQPIDGKSTEQAQPNLSTRMAKQDAAPATPAPAPLFPPQRSHGRRIEAQAYLFWRPGGDTPSLAERGELGGSQIAARIAVPLSHGLAAAGRLYAPLRHQGAEAAIGIDWRPLPSQPLRISIERRQRLDALGRSAWSAYAAGGFYRGGAPGHAIVDGYAQAGVVGTQRKDLFVDGALRIGYRLPRPKIAVTLGAGLWGAAQPQVSRLDVGPRAAVVIPIERHSLTFELDGHFRAMGNARPGSGAALTIAADF